MKTPTIKFLNHFPMYLPMGLHLRHPIIQHQQRPCIPNNEPQTKKNTTMPIPFLKFLLHCRIVTIVFFHEWKNKEVNIHKKP
jgi:hypothetical protein